jgi:hypothetical protein
MAMVITVIYLISYIRVPALHHADIAYFQIGGILPGYISGVYFDGVGTGSPSNHSREWL